MKLRDHPLLSYRGVSSWRPVWIGKDASQLKQPKSDRAILKDVVPSKTAPLTRCYLIIEHDGDEYLGAVLCDDPFACRQIYRLLLNHRGEPIGKVGEIDVPELPAVTIIKRKHCKVCGSSDNCDFKVMDDVWKTTVPIEYRDQVVCGKCFEDFAAETQIQLLRRKGI